MEFEPMLTPREKSPLPKMSPEEDRTRDAVDSEPKHYQLSYSGPTIYGDKERIGLKSLHILSSMKVFYHARQTDKQTWDWLDRHT